VKQRFAKWLIKIGYRLIGPRNTAGVTVNPKGKWQAIKL
jgi:hypothetical protein